MAKIDFGGTVEEVITSEEFTYNRHVLLNYWEKVKPDELDYKTKKKVELKDSDLTLLDDNKLLQAVYYYYNMTLSYGPMFLGWPSSNEINKEKVFIGMHTAL